MPTVMKAMMISGIMKDRKVENSEVNVASSRMTATNPVVSAMPNQPPQRPISIPAMMPIMSLTSSPSCFNVTYSSFLFSLYPRDNKYYIRYYHASQAVRDSICKITAKLRNFLLTMQCAGDNIITYDKGDERVK